MTRNGKMIGYQRVSSVDQNEARQLDGLELDKNFMDKCSGKDIKRPQLQRCLEYLREGDLLVVHSLDRLARNLADLRKLVDDLVGRGVTVRFVKENLEVSGADSAMNNLLLNMLGAVAEFERTLIRERQREGIALAVKKGLYKGRKPSLTTDQTEELRSRVLAGVAKATLAREYGISRETLYAYLRVNREVIS